MDNNGYDVVDLTEEEETNWWEGTINWIWAPVAAVLGIAVGAGIGVAATSAHYKKLADERNNNTVQAQAAAQAETETAQEATQA